LQQVIRDCIKSIGFDGLQNLQYHICIDQHPPSFSGTVLLIRPEEDKGTEDQGHMFGYHQTKPQS